MRVSVSDLNRKDLMKVARTGDADAQYEVAIRYIYGERGFPVNKRQARVWYKKSMLNGNLEAMWNLGSMYTDGEGGRVDVNEGMRLIRIVAETRKNHPAKYSALKFLSEVYRDGYLGITPDANEAEYWQKKFDKICMAYRKREQECLVELGYPPSAHVIYLKPRFHLDDLIDYCNKVKSNE